MKRVKAFLAIGLISSMLLAGCQRNGEPLSKWTKNTNNR